MSRQRQLHIYQKNWEKERERERERVCVCACACVRVCSGKGFKHSRQREAILLTSVKFWFFFKLLRILIYLLYRPRIFIIFLRLAELYHITSSFKHLRFLLFMYSFLFHGFEFEKVNVFGQKVSTSSVPMSAYLFSPLIQYKTICIYDVMVVVTRNGLGDPSSNPARDFISG